MAKRMSRTARRGGGEDESGSFGGGQLAAGRSAAYIDPKMIPNDELLPRDDSGGPDYDDRLYRAHFGDGGYVMGSKAHLSARGGSEDEKEDGEESRKERGKGA